MKPIDKLSPKEIKMAIVAMSLNLSPDPLTPAEQGYLQTLKDADEFGVERALVMARARAIDAKKSSIKKIVKTPEAIAAAQKTLLANSPEVQAIIRDRDEAISSKILAARMHEWEVDRLNIVIVGLKNQLAEAKRGFFVKIKDAIYDMMGL